MAEPSRRHGLKWKGIVQAAGVSGEKEGKDEQSNETVASLNRRYAGLLRVSIEHLLSSNIPFEPMYDPNHASILSDDIDPIPMSGTRREVEMLVLLDAGLYRHPSPRLERIDYLPMGMGR